MCLFYFRPAIELTLFIPLPLTLEALGNLLMADNHRVRLMGC